MDNICERAQGNLWACVWSICEGLIHGEYLDNIYGEYLCELKIIYELVYVFFVSELKNLRPENLYLNKSHPYKTIASCVQINVLEVDSIVHRFNKLTHSMNVLKSKR